jgi:hypothetical protein
MLGVLGFGFCGFLSFCVGVCGFLAGACWLWLFWFCFLCWCAGCGSVCIGVFFLLGVGVCREVARRFLNWISALHT